MKFSEKYISTSEKALDDKSTKIVLSDEMFAIGELLDELIKVGRSLI